MNDPNYATDT